jgi:serine/threonine protein kinase/tetratricopeptide (TPR) repeat protein
MCRVLAPEEQAPSLECGQMLSHYRVVSKLGAGGMGEVYLAEDIALERPVALKVLSPAVAKDPTRLERFRREAKAIAALSHPHIVTIYAVEETAGIPVIAMEYVEGDTLSCWVRTEGLAIAKVCEWGIALASALTAAHEKGIIHRDLKAANVMVTADGRVKVLDFGLAKLATGRFAEDHASSLSTRAAALTTEGAVVGTVPYMSPEQLQGLPVDHRTDLFSLGVLLYELAVGQRPFVGASGAVVASSILRDTPVPLTEVRHDAPGELARIIAHCLRKDVRDRYQTARDVFNDLRELYQELDGRARQPRPTSGAQARADHASGPSSPVNSGEVRMRSPELVTPLGSPVGPYTDSTPWVAPAPSRQRPWRRLAFGAVAIIALITAFWVVKENLSRSSPPANEGTSVATAPQSIVVMPFVDLSPEGGQEYLTIGLTEELVNSLARLPELRVAAYKLKRNDQARSLDVPSIVQQMHIGKALEGSVTKVGNRVRIRVQLTKWPHGDKLWAETYDRTLDDILAVQDDIAKSVATALQVTLLTRPSSPTSGSPEAYNLVLQAQYLRSKGNRGAYDTALQLLEKAKGVDPANARVFAEMSRLYFARASAGGSEADFGESWKAANRAVELNPNLADAHQALGWFSMTKNWDWSAADASFKRALALEPRSVRALRSAAVLANAMGRFDEAINLARRATEIEPTNAQSYFNLSIYQRKGGQADGALLTGRQSLELDPELSGTHFQLGAVHLVKGNVEDAIREFQQEVDAPTKARGLAMAYYSAGQVAASDKYLRELIHEGDARNIAQVYAWRNENDEAFKWLDRAYAERDWGLIELNGEPLWGNLPRDPRWMAFLTGNLKLPA